MKPQEPYKIYYLKRSPIKPRINKLKHVGKAPTTPRAACCSVIKYYFFFKFLEKYLKFFKYFMNIKSSTEGCCICYSISPQPSIIQITKQAILTHALLLPSLGYCKEFYMGLPLKTMQKLHLMQSAVYTACSSVRTATSTKQMCCNHCLGFH